MKNWMRNSGGGVVGSAEHSEAELTDEEADRVNAYEARLHEVTSSLATEAEVDELLLQAKIEVARRNAIASHQGVPMALLRARQQQEGGLPFAPLRRWECHSWGT